MFFAGRRGHIFVDRGDPASEDFVTVNFTTDGLQHDLDLSSVVPTGAKAVLLGVTVEDNAVGNYITFRKKGNINSFNAGTAYVLEIDEYCIYDIMVFPDENGIIEYQTSNTAFGSIFVQVRGWFI